MSSLGNKLIKGSIWSFFGQIVTLVIVLATNIWLARLLSPKEFGQIGIIMFFIIIANVFTEGGLAGALVRKKEATKEDYATVFIFNFIVSIFCYLLLVLFSGSISGFYNDIQLQNLIIVSGLILIVNAFQITINARLMSELKFKQKTIYKFISILLASIIGVSSAYFGAGVWSMVIVQLAGSFILTLLLWIFHGFEFSIKFNKKSFKELYGFGVNTTLASLLNTAFDNIYQLILGKYFSLHQVGYFYQAKKLQDVPGGVINMLTQSVVFSSLAKLQDDKKKFAEAYNKITLFFTVTLGFISCFIYIYAEPIVNLLFGKEWSGAIFFMKLLTIASFFYLQELINRIIFKVFDETKQILYLELVKKFIQSISIVLGLFFMDLNILIIGFVITSIISYFINYYYSRKILNESGMIELLNIIKIVFFGIAISVLFVYFHQYFEFKGVKILITLPIFIIIYFLGLQLLNIFNLKKQLSLIKKYRT